MTTDTGSSSDDRRAVVVGVDGSDGSLAALRFGAEAAAARDAELVAVMARSAHRHNPFADFGRPSPSDAALREEAAEDLAGFLAQHDVGRPVTSSVGIGPAAGVLLVAATDAAMLVVGSRGRGAVTSLVLGSTSLQAVLHAHVPVAVVPDAPDDDVGPVVVGPVVVGIDGSPAADEALRWAAADAAGRGVPLRAVLAYDYLNQPDPSGAGTTFDPAFDTADAHRAARAIVTRVLGDADARQVEAEAVLGLSTTTLVEQAVGACELVVGSRGRGGFAGLLVGSTSLGVLQRARCPVVVHRSDGPDDNRR